MSRKQLLLLFVVSGLTLIINSGCIPSYDKEVMDTTLSAAEQAQLRMKVYGVLLEDSQLQTTADEWQKKVFLSVGDHLYADGVRVIKEADTHTLISLTDLSQNKFLKNQTRQMDRYSKTVNIPGFDMTEINREETQNQAIWVSVSHVYPNYQGVQLKTMATFLPSKTEVRQYELRPSISPFSVKLKTKWNTVLTDSYAALYPSFISGSFAIPEIADFESKAAKWTFHSGMADVWSSMMHVASQYHGILAIADNNGQKGLICRRILPIENDKKQSTFKAILLAVVVMKDAENLITVYCAPMTETGTLEALVERSLLSLPKEELGSTSLDSTNYLTGVDIASRKLFSYLQPESNIQKSKDKEKEKAEITQTTIRQQAICVHRLFQELGVQLFGPGIWAQKYTLKSVTPTAESLSSSPRISKMKKIPEKYQAAATYVGQEIDDTLLITQVQVVDPNLQKMVDDITNRLVQISGRLATDMSNQEMVGPVRVRIIASPDVQAFALPNGEIFVCSGLFDTLDNSDELAAVFAHELSHVICQDVAGQLWKQAKTRKTVEMVSQGVSFGIGVAGPVMAASAASAGSSVSMGTQMGLSVAQGAISGLSTSAAQTFAAAAIEGYSQEAELRADEFAVTSLAAAGYNSQNMLNLLETLQKKQEQSDKENLVQQQRMQSSLINAKPGLKDRIANVRMLLAQK